jgi:DNA-binding CsgD family transcriptional regulator
VFQRYLERIQAISEFLARAPHPDQALEFLSAHASPLDEVAVISRAVVDHDGVMRVENIRGFSKYEIISRASMHISQQRPIATAARTQKIVWAHIDTVIQEFPDFIHFDSETPWKSSVTLPIGLKYVYGLSFPSDVTAFDNINNYFESIRSIIMIYESALDLKGVINSRRVIEESEVQPLSERQNKILDLLKTGRTNKEIAEVIGYSESLVRHETMIIYKKLRVEGRNQLRESS